MNKPNELMKEYLEIDADIKLLTKRKETLRKTIIPQLEEDEWEGLKLTKKKIILWNDDAFLEWVKQEFPDYIDKVTKQVLDYEKFESYVASGEINYEELPEHVYRIRVDNVINRT